MECLNGEWGTLFALLVLIIRFMVETSWVLTLVLAICSKPVSQINISVKYFLGLRGSSIVHRAVQILSLLLVLCPWNDVQSCCYKEKRLYVAKY